MRREGEKILNYICLATPVYCEEPKHVRDSKDGRTKLSILGDGNRAHVAKAMRRIMACPTQNSRRVIISVGGGY
jgi:hypothetical protein